MQFIFLKLCHFFIYFSTFFFEISQTYELNSNTDSFLDLIRVKKLILQQEILKKKRYLSSNYGVIDFPMDTTSYNNDFSNQKNQRNTINYQKYPQFYERETNEGQNYEENPRKYHEELKNYDNRAFQYKNQNNMHNQQNFIENPGFFRNYNQNSKESTKFQQNTAVLKNNANLYPDDSASNFFYPKNMLNQNLKPNQQNNINPKQNFRFKEENQRNIDINNQNFIKNNNKTIEDIANSIKAEVERKMLIEITSNFSRFSDNINNVINLLSKISNDTLKTTEIQRNYLIKQEDHKDKYNESSKNSDKNEEINDLKENFNELNKHDKSMVFNYSIVHELINNQIENQFKHYFSLVPNELLKPQNTIKTENINKNNEISLENKNNEVDIEKNIKNTYFNKIFNKFDKWDIIDNKTENPKKTRYFPLFH